MEESRASSILRGKSSYSQGPMAGENLRQKKMLFDDSQFINEERILTLARHRSNHTLAAEFIKPYVSISNISKKSSSCFLYFCDWFPELFGIDEDVIPLTDEEDAFLEECELEELEERAKALTESELSALREGNWRYMSDGELREAWKNEQIPRYGRRARMKPTYYREEDGEKFECICNVDHDYIRHHNPQFDGGVRKEGEEWRVPHFVAYWEEFYEKANLDVTEDWSKIFETQVEGDDQFEKGYLFRPVPKFPGSTTNDIKKFREQLLSSFRPLDCREIRREVKRETLHLNNSGGSANVMGFFSQQKILGATPFRYRMPFAEALYLELQEDRYFESSLFFKYLIIKDHFEHQALDNFSPPLRKNKPKLKKIVAFLKMAERFSRRKEYHKEATILLKSGKYFNDHDEFWWWLAEEFYAKAVKVSQKSVIDGGKSEAIARYIYGTFLLESVYKVQAAQEHLSKARDLSIGKDWNAGRIMHKKQESVYKECVNYLCISLIAASRELRKKGKPEEALPLIHRSYKLCKESETSRRDIEMETYFELGMTYQSAGMLNWAKTAFRKFMELAKLENYTKSLCDGFLETAICYRSEGDLTRCHHYLNKYLETAISKEDENLEAFGNRYLGEFHLNNGDAKLALEFFDKAFKSFHKQCTESLDIPFSEWKPQHFTLLHDVELTRVLMGLADGEVITKPICHLILQVRDGKNQMEALNLINWKISGERYFMMDDTEYEEPAVIFEGDALSPQKYKLGLEVREESWEVLPDNSEVRTVRFALDENRE